MNIKCIFGHKYVVVDNYKYRDVSWGFDIPSTIFLYRCNRCNKHKKDVITGLWDLNKDNINNLKVIK